MAFAEIGRSLVAMRRSISSIHDGKKKRFSKNPAHGIFSKIHYANNSLTT
ncbi:hypothetical protein Pla52o_21790 [Novipirellula galeiformis]|uniref:Uncharacterized protein n=1 Tax=Novipirellula galeiformis TaxID=2528004 RepID=A0A5C6CH77_9BACT|nr:hypothetical protein Pla52o_21790 [Novipirellula galeiformis]